MWNIVWNIPDMEPIYSHYFIDIIMLCIVTQYFMQFLIYMILCGGGYSIEYAIQIYHVVNMYY